MEVIIAIGALAIVAGLATQLFSKRNKTLRKLKDAKKVSIGSFPGSGPAKVVGKLSYLGEPLISPLTGRPCAYYEILVERYDKDSDGSGHWESFIKEVAEVEFTISDESGYAIVNPSNAHVAIYVDRKTKSGTFDDPTSEEESFLRRHFQAGSGRSFGFEYNKSLRYQEGILEEGELVAVYGHGVWESDPNGASKMRPYAKEPPMRLRLNGSKEMPLYISDEAKAQD